MSQIATPDNLNDIMEFDHVIEILPSGKIQATGLYAPDDIEYDDRFPIGIDPDIQIGGHAWEALVGHSLHTGSAVFHPSEYIGGGLADYLLATPGIYVVVVVRDMDVNADDGEDDAVGWAILRYLG